LLESFGYIGLFLGAIIALSVVIIFIPVILRRLGVAPPQKPNPVKSSIYECGVPTVGKTWVQFNFRYYFYALVFLALDVLFIFLYPWAVSLRKLGVFSLSAVLILILIVLVGYIYAWRKNVLEWK